MSWSFSGVGMPKAVMASMIDWLSKSKCSEPEETIKNRVIQIAQLSIDAMPEDHPVKIEAGGSQSTTNNPAIALNQLNLRIDPLWGFKK